MFITFCSCIQNIHTRVDKLFRKCLRKMRAQDHDNDDVGDDGSNTNSRTRNTPLAWSDGQDDNSSRQSGAYTVDHVYHLPSLGQMEDPPPQYNDVIAAEPLPPSYEEATKT
ncbi:hypothetical protein HOLleu_12850 [Holothuria leucospilota]|uniref:Uncharacterized protein n=1 Tax=Holothuria leucospilota TaxID=206669 RepID=A0A9Q1CBL3_HOLLE|nr:hypothetical protein HOLleu_12850 [Holothuria leucospilota]